LAEFNSISLLEHGRLDPQSATFPTTSNCACTLREQPACQAAIYARGSFEATPQRARLLTPVAHAHRSRRTAEGRAYGLSLMGVGAGSLIYHSSSGRCCDCLSTLQHQMVHKNIVQF